MKTKFKDVCDICGKMDYCAGFNGKVLCSKCTEKEKKKNKDVKK
jgi:uncharacterized membrane protein